MDHPNVRPVHAAQVLHLSFLRGRFADVAARLARYVEQYPQQHSLRAELARLRLHEGNLDDARRQLEALAKNDFKEIPCDGMWLLCLAYAAEVAARLGDRKRCKILREVLSPYADRVFGAGTSIVSLGHGARYLGLLTATLGRHEEAAELLATATREHERMQARPWIAFSLLDQARLRSQNAGRRTRTEADDLAERALGLARDVGLPALERDALALRSRGLSRNKRSPFFWEGSCR
jgi:tetratricopeptide (TPR) repeat protein